MLALELHLPIKFSAPRRRFKKRGAEKTEEILSKKMIEIGTLSTDNGTAEFFSGNNGCPQAAFVKPFLAEKERAVREFEREYFARLLEKYHGNVSKTAREAGISRQNVSEKLKRLGIKPQRFR